MIKIKKIFTVLVSLLLFFQANSQVEYLNSTRFVKNDIFRIWYNEDYQQPVRIKYEVECPTGNADRSGMSFYKVDTIITSDDADYVDNEWDKGHMAPAASFNCDEETLRLTFSYLNCALQHEGLNRGPWKELERFERDLAKVFNVHVIIDVQFEDKDLRLESGALVPTGFVKKVFIFDQEGEETLKVFKFNFPNQDVSGQDWSNFKVIEE